MLTRRRQQRGGPSRCAARSVIVSVTIFVAGCSSPHPYAEAGRLLTLPGIEGGSALVPAEAGAAAIEGGSEAGGDDAFDNGASDAGDATVEDALFDARGSG